MSEILKAFMRNEQAIRRYIARYRSDVQDVEDFTQETFLRGFAAETKGDIREPKAFLFKIAKNIALLDIRKKKRGPTDFIEDSGGSELLVDEEQLTADAWLDGRRKLVLLSKAAASLPPKCRKAFLMRRVEGLQYKQIANRMNISVSAVEKHVMVGLLKCNSYLREHGYDAAEFGGAPVNRNQQPALQSAGLKAVKLDEKK
ncbi:MAG: RNA polymerase subunit sigma-24 [Kordiimonadales bacterium]|nr:MAG: RNA polymerase subunit sigma-24 [Kordiimonadales bacterium]